MTYPDPYRAASPHSATHVEPHPARESTPPSTNDALQAALDRIAYDSASALSAALLIACGIVAVVDVLARPAPQAAVLGVATASCAAVVLAIRRLFRRGRIPPEWSHGLTAAMSSAIVVMLLHRALYVPGPIQLSGVAVVMIASGFFLLSTRWLLAVLALASAGWASVVGSTAYHEFEVGAILMVIAGSVISVGGHVGRLRSVMREEGLRIEADRSRTTLALSEARVRMILDTALDGVIMMDAAGRVSDWNPQAEAIFGWTRDEAIDQPVSDLVVPERHRRRFAEGARRFLDDGDGTLLDRRVELVATHRDGHEFPVEVSVSALRIGDVVSFGAFVRDITVRRQMEQALREELRISQAMAKVSYELSVTTGAEELLDKLCKLTTEVLDCEFSYSMLLGEGGEWEPIRAMDTNSSDWEAVRLLRFPAEPLVSSMRDRSVLELSPAMPEVPMAWLMDRYGISAVLLIGLRRGDEVIGIQTAGYRRATSGFSPIQIRAAKELAKVASIALENARLVEELRRANRLKSEFVATMSHELRTPLNVILGYEELLLDGAFDPLQPDQGEIVQRIGRSARELHDLITATLDLSRLEAGRAELNLEDVDLLDLAKEIENEMRTLQIDKPQVRMKWKIPTNAPEVLTDRAKLKVVLKNLLNNGLKFTDEGEVIFEAQETARGVRIVVADTGIGIPESSIASIFEPFLQIDASPTRRHGGVGLGLHIVQRLVDMLGGQVGVESRVDKGTRFIIDMPHSHPSVPSDPEWDVSDDDAVSSDPLKVA